MPELHHIVLLKIRADADSGAVDAAFAAARAMAGQIDGVLHVAAGPDVSVEGLAAGHTHAVLVRFADEAARERYFPHPAHLALGERMQPLTEGAVVVDIAG
jgi:Stress responsive A/B Barrel Domain